MKVKLLSILFAVLLLTIVISGCFEEKPKTSSYDILVDDDGDADYSKIQDAIDNASNGDTIYVKSGTYNESIMIFKPITLIGENKDTTIIDRYSKTSKYFVKSTIDIYADNITIDGFTINDNSYAIKIYSDYNKISNNVFTDNLDGVALEGANNNIITNNIFRNNSISLKSNACYNYVAYNTIKDSTGGISLTDSYENTIEKNNIIACNNDGISIWTSDKNKIIKNTITDTLHSGIVLQDSNNNLISKNSIKDNNQGIVLLESSYNTLKLNLLSDNEHGLTIHSVSSAYDNGSISYSENNTIYQNNFENTIANCLDGSTDLKNNSNVFYNESIKTGNYWDDYIGIHLENIEVEDKVYYIYPNSYIKEEATNKDKYPSITPFDI